MSKKLLIVCHTQEHARKVKEAFQIDADYYTWGDALLGRRWERIIAFRPPDPKPQDTEYFEQLQHKLPPGGKIYIV